MSTESANDDQKMHQKVLEDVAIEWIARLRATDVTDAERAEFATWLAEDPAHAGAFDDMLDLWGLTGQIETVPENVVEFRTDRKRWIPLAAAATILLSFAVLLLNPQSTSYETILGEQRRVLLSDGTTVYLNTSTELTVQYSDTQRNVELSDSGEAYFEVAKDPARPFTVRTRRGTATALGTAFNVYAGQNATEVAVTEGLVAVARLGERARKLAANESALITSADVVRLAEPNAGETAAWRTGRLVYSDVRLEDLLEDLNRYVPQPMAVANEQLGELRISAVLQLQEQQAMVQALAGTLDLEWTTVSDNLILLHQG